MFKMELTQKCVNVYRYKYNRCTVHIVMSQTLHIQLYICLTDLL